MKKLFFLYVWLNLTRILTVFKENLVKHIRKRTSQDGNVYCFSYHSSKIMKNYEKFCILSPSILPSTYHNTPYRVYTRRT